jgi:hypothetical protein
MKTATEKQILKPVKISKKIPPRKLRKALRDALRTIEFQDDAVAQYQDLVDYARAEKEKAQDDFERQRIGYLDKTERLDEATRAIDYIIAELHNSAIIQHSNFPDAHDTRGAVLIANEIITRVNQIAADFSRARDEQIAVLERDHHQEILDVEKRLESAYEEMRRERDAEVIMRGHAERHLTQAGISAQNAWARVERLESSWWRRLIAWANGTGPTFIDNRIPSGVDPATGRVFVGPDETPGGART